MAGCYQKVPLYLFGFDRCLITNCRKFPIVVGTRRNSFFKHLAQKSEHNEDSYKFKVTHDPKEWQYVQRLLPLETVPNPAPKATYPSGWQPVKENSLNQSYFVERSKNHMLSVYLKLYVRGQMKVTKLTKVHGNIWNLHDDLKGHIEDKIGKKICSYVHEGNNAIHFRGDYVYHVEQWLLQKGF